MSARHPVLRDMFLTTHQLSERWGGEVLPGTLENWRKEGKGPSFIRLSGGKRSSIVYRESDVVAYELRQSKTPKAVKKNG